MTYMKSRIAVLGSGTSRSELPAHFSNHPDGEAWAAPIRLSAFARSDYERLIVDVGYVDAAQNAAPRSDAVFINSFADYGIDAMRSVLTTPVIGAGEATLTEAARIAQKFAIVTVWPESMLFLYEERLRRLGLTARCCAIIHCSAEAELERVGREDGVMERMHRGEPAILATLRNACVTAVEKNGAECVVLGCTCMASIGTALAATCSFPVLESSRVGFAASIVAAKSSSHQDKAKTNSKLVVSLVDSWTGSAGMQSAPKDADCPICL